MSVSQQGLLANDTSLTQDWPPGPCENAQDLKDFGFSGRTTSQTSSRVHSRLDGPSGAGAGRQGEHEVHADALARSARRFLD